MEPDHSRPDLSLLLCAYCLESQYRRRPSAELVSDSGTGFGARTSPRLLATAAAVSRLKNATYYESVLVRLVATGRLARTPGATALDSQLSISSASHAIRGGRSFSCALMKRKAGSCSFAVRSRRDAEAR